MKEKWGCCNKVILVAVCSKHTGQIKEQQLAMPVLILGIHFPLH